MKTPSDNTIILRAELPSYLRKVARLMVTDPVMIYVNVEQQAVSQLIDRHFAATINTVLKESIKTLADPPVRATTKVCRIPVIIENSAIKALHQLPRRVTERVVSRALRNIFETYFLQAVLEIVDGPQERGSEQSHFEFSL